MAQHGGARPGAGRPPKRPEERQDATLTVYFTAAEYEQLAKVAESEGASMAGYVRRVLQRNLARKRGGRRT